VKKEQQQQQSLIPLGKVGYMDQMMSFGMVRNQSFGKLFSLRSPLMISNIHFGLQQNQSVKEEH